MNTQMNTLNADPKTLAGLEFETATRQIIKMSKAKPGDVFVGCYEGTRQREITLTKDDQKAGLKKGDKKMVTDNLFNWQGDLFAIADDTGLQIALKDVGVKEGDILAITKLPQVDLENGNRVNQYKIARAKKPTTAAPAKKN